MKPTIMVMSVVEVNGNQSVSCTMGLGDGKEFKYLGSLNCDFTQFGIVNSFLKKVPTTFLDYRNEKWQNYLNKILEELASL